MDFEPTEEQLAKIRDWHYSDFPGLMRYIEDEVWIRDMGWFQNTNPMLEEVFDQDADDGHYWACATGGWSGNEEIIEALQENVMFWACCWCGSMKGGYHEWHVKPLKCNGCNEHAGKCHK